MVVCFFPPLSQYYNILLEIQRDASRPASPLAEFHLCLVLWLLTLLLEYPNGNRHTQDGQNSEAGIAHISLLHEYPFELLEYIFFKTVNSATLSLLTLPGLIHILEP